MRRTKKEAAETRRDIVDAALDCFDRYGIAGSTLQQIATAAGVTKGAIYHHFAGKREILHEIRDQVTLPFLDEADTALLQRGELPALDRVERFLSAMLAGLVDNPRKRLALGVMLFRCEYVGELADELDSMRRNYQRLTQAFAAAYDAANTAGDLAPGLAPQIAAIDTVMFLSGLVRLWLLNGPRSTLRKHAADVIRTHVQSRRRSLDPQ